MSKTKTFETIMAGVEGLYEAHNVKSPARAAITEFLTAELAPRAAGNRVDLGEVTQVDASGNVTHIFCSVAQKFLPATLDFFYEDKHGKGINGLKRLSRQAEAVRKTFIKVQTASKNAIMDDLMTGAITSEEAKAALTELTTKVPDFSSVTDVLPVETAAE